MAYLWEERTAFGPSGALRFETPNPINARNEEVWNAVKKAINYIHSGLREAKRRRKAWIEERVNADGRM